MQLVGKQACSSAVVYQRGLCDAVIKGVQVVKKERQEMRTAREKALETGVARSIGHPEDVLFEVELDDMCEEDTSMWEELAEKEWNEYKSLPGESHDSTTGEVLDPAKVKEGCAE